MALRRPRSKRKTAGGCLALVLVIAGILIFGPVVRDFVDAPFNPWAHSWRGSPTLTGTWVGVLTSPAGRGAGVFLDLHRARTGRGNSRYSTCRTCPRIKGAARVCGGGAVQSYEVWGGPDTWGGEQFHLSAGLEGPETAAPRLHFLRGEWEGDVLKITTKLGQDGGGQDADAEVRFGMRRGGEGDFQALCRKLGGDW